MPKKKPTTFCKNPLTIKDFESLPQDGETILLDDESLDTMYYVQETLRRLEPEGMDDVRTLRIETIGPKNKIYWYDVTVHIYKDMHGIYLHSYQGERYYFTNKEHLNEDPNPVRHNCKKFLDKLWQYLADVVHQVGQDPRVYTRYLEEHIPYQEREGYVVRGQIQDILPGIKIDIANREQVLEILKRRQEIPADGTSSWPLALAAMPTKASALPSPWSRPASPSPLWAQRTRSMPFLAKTPSTSPPTSATTSSPIPARTESLKSKFSRPSASSPGSTSRTSTPSPLPTSGRRLSFIPARKTFSPLTMSKTAVLFVSLQKTAGNTGSSDSAPIPGSIWRKPEPNMLSYRRGRNTNVKKERKKCITTL